MAPEVIKNRGHGKEVDWWSLGTLMYDMMNGNPPFQGETREATIKLVISVSKIKLATLNNSKIFPN